MMKTGKNKRLLAGILAASMLLAMSPFALAEEAEDTTGQEQSQGQPTEVSTEGSGNTTGGSEGTGIAEAEESVTPSEAQSEIAEPETRLTSSGPRRIIRPADKATQTYQFYRGESTDPYYTETIQSNDTLKDPEWRGRISRLVSGRYKADV